MAIVKTAQQSLLDLILDVMPSLRDFKIRVIRRGPNDPSASKLYDLWNDESSRIAARHYRRPADMSKEDVKSMISAGLVAEHGSQLKITDKGVQVVRSMILNDPSCAFDTAEDRKIASKVSTTQSKSNIYRSASKQLPMRSWYNAVKNQCP